MWNRYGVKKSILYMISFLRHIIPIWKKSSRHERSGISVNCRSAFPGKKGVGLPLTQLAWPLP